MRMKQPMMNAATTARVFTPEDWKEHEKYVQMFRAAKQRKREWQARMETVLAEKEAQVRARRAEIDALFSGTEDETT